MKYIFLGLIIILPFLGKAEIDDQSFKNTDKYKILKGIAIANTDSINLDFNFFPPKGKKVNTASYVKIWEKKEATSSWELTENVELSSSSEEFDGHILTHNSILKSKNSSVAVEVDFIHCNYNGGQCDQERYLAKLKRVKSIANVKVKYDLKI